MKTRRMKGLSWASCLVMLMGATARADRPAFQGHVALFGNLHSHSKLSDDVEGAGDEMLPSAAFAHAHENGLDFLASSDHHKATDSEHRLWLTAAEYKTHLFDAAMAYNEEHEGDFV